MDEAHAPQPGDIAWFQEAGSRLGGRLCRVVSTDADVLRAIVTFRGRRDRVTVTHSPRGTDGRYFDSIWSDPRGRSTLVQVRREGLKRLEVVESSPWPPVVHRRFLGRSLEIVEADIAAEAAELAHAGYAEASREAAPLEGPGRRTVRGCLLFPFAMLLGGLAEAGDSASSRSGALDVFDARDREIVVRFERPAS